MLGPGLKSHSEHMLNDCPENGPSSTKIYKSFEAKIINTLCEKMFYFFSYSVKFVMKMAHLSGFAKMQKKSLSFVFVDVLFPYTSKLNNLFLTFVNIFFVEKSCQIELLGIWSSLKSVS